MKREQIGLAFGVLENLPTILFLALWKGGFGLEVASWSASLAAAAVLIGFKVCGRPADTIVLGINLSFLWLAPGIRLLFELGAAETARGVIAFSGSCVLATVLASGLAQAALSRRGVLGLEEAPARARRTYSLALLGLMGLAVAWSVFFAGDQWMAIVLPLVILFTARRFFLARIADRRNTGSDPMAAGAAVIATPVSDAV